MRHAIALLALSMASPAYAENCKTNVTGFTYCDSGRMFKESSNGYVYEYGTGGMWKKDGFGNTYEVYKRPDAPSLPPALFTSPYQIEDPEK